MKNLLLIPVMIFALTSVKASVLPTFNLIKGKTFVLEVKDWKADELNISLSSEDGEVIYSESIQPAIKRHRKFNLELLPRGTYEMVVSDQMKSVTYDIEISNDDDIEISEGKTAYMPQISYSDEKIDINLLSQNETVKIFLYDYHGNNIYYKSIRNAMVIEKRLDISKLENGDYTLSMNVGDKWYSNTFEK